MSTKLVNVKAKNIHVVHLEKPTSVVKITNDKVKNQQYHNNHHQKKKQQIKTTKVPIVIPKKTSASAPNTPQQQRRTVLPVKARRVERRKEIKKNNKQRQSDQAIVVPVVHKKRSSSVIDIRSSVYAGPTFNNSPAPSALPMPAFSPTLVSIELLEREKLSRHSKDLMNILSPQPLKNDFDMDLSEIQRGLRSMLKI
ncbi:hypothetical protein INT48_001493 [Thamnidium elegans]|uniref:Uncharacterized protein n=1 Tax=Thamnidium elegans TaxID=101142 RepID=A0A8H7SIR4_9FUNG|nr:hypothetical protein INT48_001493 [Thamnidium elegans]